MQCYIKSFNNIILYNGEFYNEKEESIYLHNRLNNIYNIKNINLISNDILAKSILYDKTLIFLEGFHENKGHLLWDSMYPGWYLLFFLNEDNWNSDFQCITIDNMYKRYSKGWNLEILKIFSGNNITTPDILSNLHNKPIKIKKLIGGIKNLGIGCVDRTMCISKSFKSHNLDPIETFINRLYLRYNIKRNYYGSNNNNINNIIYIHNKRPYNGIKEIFEFLNKKYENLYNFLYIDWSKYTFEEHLKIANSTRIIICGVGTARTNTPFLPNYSIEIQTNTHNKDSPNNISYFDCHIGTISNYIKVINIKKYSTKEVNKKSISSDLLYYIEEYLNNIPYKKNINIKNNIPQFLRRNILNKVSEEDFKKWRKECNNDSAHLYKYINI